MLSPKNVKRSIFGHKKSHRERDAERIEELGRELGSFKMQVQTTEELNKALNQENELLRLRFEKIDAELEEMRAKVMDVESRNRDLERTVNAAQEELEEFENYKSAIEKEVSEKKENTLTMILDLESKLKKKEVEVEEMKKSQESVQNSKKDLRLTLKKLANSVNNLKEHEKDLKPKEISHMKIEIFLELDEILKSYRDWMH